MINLIMCTSKNIRGFVRCKNTESLHVCDKCFRVFRDMSAFENHSKNNKCEFIEEAKKCLPVSEKLNPKTGQIDKELHKVKFQNYYKQLNVPFVIYADGESILNKVNPDESKNTQVYQNHQVYNLGCKFVSEFPDILDDTYKEFTGENCMIDFLKYVFEMQDKALELLASKNQKPMFMTESDKDIPMRRKKSAHRTRSSRT